MSGAALTLMTSATPDIDISVPSSVLSGPGHTTEVISNGTHLTFVIHPTGPGPITINVNICHPTLVPASFTDSAQPSHVEPPHNPPSPSGSVTESDSGDEEEFYVKNFEGKQQVEAD
ncbi:hypothetical protein FPV67DRAFT_1665592 [Lyophyllum atratum]|nr:hypothetical protein FPV67DRAFT_1668852 [Lyophyllum atratum]KAF8074831.1 hypothetical protein FPV67DRAFT_1665592 [Lyophyllum atratum]